MKIRLSFLLPTAFLLSFGTTVLAHLLNSISSHKTNKTTNQLASSFDANFEPYTDAEKYSQAQVIAIAKVVDWGNTVMTPGDIPFTTINLQVKRNIFSVIGTPKELSVFHEGSPEKQYDNFELPEVGKEYLVFLNYDEQLKGLQIRAPESIRELVVTDSGIRAIAPNLKSNLERLYKHKRHNEMPEFKDNQYVTLESGEKVKLTASKSLDDFINEVITVCASPGKCGIKNKSVPSPDRE